MSTIDPFAFGKGLQEGAQFNPPPDPLKQAQIQAATLDRQIKAQQLQAQTQELQMKMQDQRMAYNSRQTLTSMVQANPKVSVEELEGAGVSPTDIDNHIKVTAAKAAADKALLDNRDIISKELTDAFVAAGDDDPAKLMPIQNEVYRKLVAAGVMKKEDAQASMDSGQIDTVAALKAFRQKLSDAQDQADKEAVRVKNLADEFKARQDGRLAQANADEKQGLIGGAPQSKNELTLRLRNLFGNNQNDPLYQGFAARAQATPENPALLQKVLDDAIKKSDELLGKKAEEITLGPLKTQQEINAAVGKAKATQGIDIDTAVKKQAALQPGELAKSQAEATARANEPTQRLKDQVTDSDQALQQTALVRQLVAAHPEIIGPVMGRLAKGSVSVGTSFGFATPEQENAAARLQTNLGNLLLNEARVASPGRSNAQVMQILKDQSAAMGKNPAMIEGALKGVEDRAQMAIQEGQRKGINTPGASGAPRKITESLVQANMRANPSATRQQIVDELKKHNYVE